MYFTPVFTFAIYPTSRLGQACNHIAALLFFIDDHVGDNLLPSEISKTSQPMKWNQPPKKEIAPAQAQGADRSNTIFLQNSI